MVNCKVPLVETRAFSGLFLDYISGVEKLFPFINLPPTLDSFQEQINAKKRSYSNREVLAAAVKEQHEGLVLTEKQQENLRLLNEASTFTITTGHQLCLATGPLYFIYKILTTIKLAEELKEQYPDQHFVPIYWLASEDHDVEEINHFFLFGKKFTWNIPGKGPAGRLSSKEAVHIFQELKDIPAWLTNAYAESANLAEAMRKIVSYLFGEYGLLIVDGDNVALKSLFKDQVKKELLESKYAALLKQQSSELERQGYKAQALVREHNFFYLEDHLRERIEFRDEKFIVNNTSLSFTREELGSLIENHPEKFSPNVLLRPLYQEVVLPNLAYVGGPGEIAYWLQLKIVFDEEKMPFPILSPRNFISLVSKSSSEKLESVGIKINDLFLSEQEYHQRLLETFQIEKFDFLKEESLLRELKESLQAKAVKADKTLVPTVEAEMVKISKSLAEFQKRLDKAMENKYDVELSKLKNIRKKLFPEGELQERVDNFLNFYINRPSFIKDIYESIDPFDFTMHCLVF